MNSETKSAVSELVGILAPTLRAVRARIGDEAYRDCLTELTGHLKDERDDLRPSVAPAGNILLPPPAPPADCADAARAVIRKHLAAMAGDLNQFGQTCHGVIVAGVEDVADYLVVCYTRPTAYTAATLAQCIAQLVREDQPA